MTVLNFRRLATDPKLWLLASAALVWTAPATRAQAAPAASESSVGEIVVTARRREERLMDVPAAVSAFSAAQLQTLNITGSKQLTQITPGLNFTQSVYSPQPTIRGIGTRGVTAGQESEVPIYVDGVYQSFLPSEDLQFNDVSRIEVLKGPQGALLGRNAMGGAINIITKDPEPVRNGILNTDLSVSYGSYNQVIAKGLVSGGTDKVAAGLAFVLNRDDGYVRDIVTGARYAVTNDFSVRGKLVLHPTDKIDVKIAVGHTSNADSTGVSFTSLNGDSIGARVPGNIVASAPFTASMPFPPSFKVFETTVAATAVLHLSGFDVTAISGYEDSVLKDAADADGTPLGLAAYFYKQYSRNEYNEIYATSKTSGPFDWLTGFVYYHDDSGNPPYVNIVLNIPGLLVGDLRTVDEVKTDSYAAYGQVGYKFNDQWSATVAGRYTTESKSLTNVNGLAGVPASFHALTNSATFSKFTPTATLQYEPNSQLNLYFKVGQAFKSGVFNPLANTVFAAQPVQPETLTQYEVGLKADIDPRLQFDLSAYYTDYSNLQSPTRTPQGASVLQNAGAATIYGLEADAFLRPIEHLNLRLGLSALHGVYSNYPNADVYFPNTTIPAPAPCAVGRGANTGGDNEQTCNVNGKTIIRTPTFTANISGDYTVPTRPMCTRKSRIRW
jgi:iron complex outermembrane receptor protein